MANCDISKGKNILACKNAVSGIKAIYIMNYSGATPFSTVSNDTVGQVITGMTIGTNSTFKFELKNSNNTFNQDIATNRDNGTTMFNQVLNFSLTKTSAEMEFQVKMLSYGRPQIFVEGNDGKIFLMGKDLGCEVGGATVVGGTLDAFGGYNLTATAMEKEPIYYLTGNALTGLTASVSTSNVTD